MNRSSSLLRSATVCKAKPLCFCRPFGGRGWLTMPAILSALLPQMTVSVALRQVTESRDQRYTQAATPAPAWARTQATTLIMLSAVPSPHAQAHHRQGCSELYISTPAARGDETILGVVLRVFLVTINNYFHQWLVCYSHMMSLLYNLLAIKVKLAFYRLSIV